MSVRDTVSAASTALELTATLACELGSMWHFRNHGNVWLFGQKRSHTEMHVCYDSFVFLWLSEGKEEYSAVFTAQNLTRLGLRLPVPLFTAGPLPPHRTH